MDEAIARSDALLACADAIKRNDELVKQALEALEAERDVVYFVLDPQAIEILLQRVLDTTNDIGFTARVGKFRYHLEQFSRKLSSHYDIYHEEGFDIDPQLRRARAGLVDSMKEHGPVIRKEAKELLDTIFGQKFFVAQKPGGGKSDESLLPFTPGR